MLSKHHPTTQKKTPTTSFSIKVIGSYSNEETRE